MSVRLRRLKADYDRICTVFTGKSRIRTLKTTGNPPERYQIEFLVPSLQKDLATQEVRTHNSFIAEIVLTGAYPRLAPQCKMLTPVFHPNIAPHAICIGDHWAAGESLPNLIVRIAEMLAFQSYNVKSPLNGEAARWVEQNQGRLPLETYDFTALLSVGASAGRDTGAGARVGAQCANCGKPAGAGELKVCLNDHVTCVDCILECPLCNAVLCLACSNESCSFCRRETCHRCIYRCATCQRLACKDHAGRCHICDQVRCQDCLVGCDRCQQIACLDHIAAVPADGRKEYHCSDCAAP